MRVTSTLNFEFAPVFTLVGDYKAPIVRDDDTGQETRRLAGAGNSQLQVLVCFPYYITAERLNVHIVARNSGEPAQLEVAPYGVGPESVGVTSRTAAEYVCSFDYVYISKGHSYLLVITLVKGDPCLVSGLAFSFEREDQSARFLHRVDIGSTSAGVYSSPGVSLRRVDAGPFSHTELSFSDPDAYIDLDFYVPETFEGCADLTVNLTLDCMNTVEGREIQGSVENGRHEYEQHRALSTTDEPQTLKFAIPGSALPEIGQRARLKITYAGPTAASIDDAVRICGARIDFTGTLPEVTKPNYERYVKDWILRRRTNIAELNAIPRDDLDAWEFIKNSPGWFFLPFLPCALSELQVVFRHFSVTEFVSVVQRIRLINQRARNFRRDLLAQGRIHRKNAMRHAFWAARLTRKLGPSFALDLTDAHEYAHVDLTIEGPFDEVTDRINNAVGIELAKNDTQTYITDLIEHAWAERRLAWSKDYRVENGVQMADLHWQFPLDELARLYNVVPDFTDSERRLLARHNIAVPNKPPIHDEL